MSNFFHDWASLARLIPASDDQRRSLYAEEVGIRYSKNTAVYWQGGAALAAGAERCSALTITWLKVTESNNGWDEAEAIAFGGEAAKTAVPIPFTKKLSSRQMMRVSGFYSLRTPPSLFFYPPPVAVSTFEGLLITIFELHCRNLSFHWWRRLWQLAPRSGNVGFSVAEIFMWKRVSPQLWCRVAVINKCCCIKRALCNMLILADISGWLNFWLTHNQLNNAHLRNGIIKKNKLKGNTAWDVKWVSRCVESDVLKC